MKIKLTELSDEYFFKSVALNFMASFKEGSFEMQFSISRSHLRSLRGSPMLDPCDPNDS